MPEEPEYFTSPAELIDKMLGGYRDTQVLYVAAKLGLFDIIRDGPKTSSELASTIGAHEPSLRRVMRYLTTVNILREDAQGRFTATAAGELLQTNHPQSLFPWAVLLGAPFLWQPWGELYETIKTGVPAFEKVYGQPYFQYLGNHPEAAALFNTAMSHNASSSNSAVSQAFDFSGFTRIVDVGGGQGTLLRSILEHYPQASGILYDLPSVVAAAHELKASAVANRCEFVGGDMFESVPMGGEIYILKRIIHDWSDAEAIQILRNCRQVMSKRGRVLLIESILQPANQPDAAKAADLMMLILVTGRERTEEEFRELFKEAGLELTNIIPTADRSIIEGVPISK